MVRVTLKKARTMVWRVVSDLEVQEVGRTKGPGSIHWRASRRKTSWMKVSFMS